MGTPHDIEECEGGDTAHHLAVYSWYGWSIKVGTRLAGWLAGSRVIIVPLRGSILQAGTCQILSLAENPRWSRVWQCFLSINHNMEQARAELCQPQGKLWFVWFRLYFCSIGLTCYLIWFLWFCMQGTVAMGC